MAKTYGNTWWGQKWLNALNRIDNSNRLPRGRTYANTGKVLEVVFKENQIKAKVRGSRPTPYKQTIGVQAFNDFEKEEIIELITQNPFILSKLMNRELPEELFNELDKNGIDLFPRRWHDFDANCSCPDSAMPCKHLAAVIYMIANEIDKNPFIVFQLHNLDILGEIQKRGFTSQGDFKVPIASVQDFFVAKPSYQDYTYQPDLISKIDFSEIPHSQATLLKLLVEKPIFYPQKDFKAVLEKAYKNISKEIDKVRGREMDGEASKLEGNIENMYIFLDNHFHYRYTQLASEENEFSLDNKQEIGDLIHELQKLHPKRLFHYAPSVVAVYLVYQFALHLLDRSAFIPQVIQTDKDKYKIRWIPALLIEEVNQVFKTLCELMPPETLCLMTRKAMLYAEKEEQVNSLLSLFINYFVSEFYGHNLHDEEVMFAFFSQLSLDASKFEFKETPAAIQKWLQKFYLGHKDHVPVIKIEETKIGNFELSFWIQNRKAELQDLISLEDLFSKKEYNDIRLEILQDLALLSEYLPQVQEVIQSKGHETIYVNSFDFVSIFLETIPALQLLGILILLPKSLQKIIKPQLSMRIQTKGSAGASKGFVNFQQMLAFDWQIALGDESVSQEEFLKLVKGLQGIVKINDQYVLIDEKEIQALIKKLENPPKITDAEILRAGLGQDYHGAKVALDKKAKALLDSMLTFDTIATPENLQATLRPYQLRGFEWMYKNARLGFGSLLADDMGLGKTLQVITLLLKLKQEGDLDKNKALIVVPTTLLTNWQKEIAKFAPDLRTWIYHGSNRKLNLEGTDIMLTSYGIARSDEKELAKIKWAFLAIDEAQNIKNEGTAQTKAIKKLKSERVVAMSGTPVENRLSEYF
jgi:uncharacterized Zn finger protein